METQGRHSGCASFSFLGEKIAQFFEMWKLAFKETLAIADFGIRQHFVACGLYLAQQYRINTQSKYLRKGFLIWYQWDLIVSFLLCGHCEARSWSHSSVNCVNYRNWILCVNYSPINIEYSLSSFHSHSVSNLFFQIRLLIIRLNSINVLNLERQHTSNISEEKKTRKRRNGEEFVNRPFIQLTVEGPQKHFS